MTSKTESKVMGHTQWLNSQIIPNNINLTTKEEVEVVTKYLKNCKAHGIDGTKVIVYKNMPETFYHCYYWCLKADISLMVFKEQRLFQC